MKDYKSACIDKKIQGLDELGLHRDQLELTLRNCRSKASEQKTREEKTKKARASREQGNQKDQ